MAWYRSYERLRGGKSYTAHKVWWRDPAGKTHSRTFHKAADRNRFMRAVETRKDEGAYIDPARGRILFRDFWEHFLATSTHLKPSSAALYRAHARRHLLPHFGNRPLNQVTVPDVRAFLVQLGQKTGSPTVRSVQRLLRRVLAVAVEEGRIPHNPAARAQVPAETRREPRFLTADEVARVAAEVPERYRALILLLAYGGLRIGEAAALRVSDLDLLRGRVHVKNALVEVEGELLEGETKTRVPRTVFLPPFLREELARHIESHRRSRGSRLFTGEHGAPLRASRFRPKVFHPACRRVGIEPLPRLHDLRHTAVALSVSAGAHPKAVQEMLGHASITMTLDRYGHLFDTLQEETAARLDAIYRNGIVLEELSST